MMRQKFCFDQKLLLQRIFTQKEILENADLYPLLSTVKTKANERQNNIASHECLKKRIKNLLAVICFLDPKEIFPCEFG